MIKNKETRKFFWETAGDARDFLKKQLLELSVRDALSLGFFVTLAYMTWRALGRVRYYEYGTAPDFQKDDLDQWFWGHLRSVIVKMWNQINLMADFTVPLINIKPLAFLSLFTIQWVPFLIAKDRKGTPPDEYWVYREVPLQFRMLFVLGFISTLFIAKETADLFIQELGELAPL